jgi:hypothetical protein
VMDSAIERLSPFVLSDSTIFDERVFMALI